MLFHYAHGALLCEIRIKGLTTNVKGWTVHNWWRDKPTDPDYVDYSDDEDYPYSHHVCESLSRSSAQRIVTALGGYMVDDSYIPVGRQLGDGGPFFVHLFDITRPMHLATFAGVQAAIDYARDQEECWPVKYPFRIYDSSGYMVMEIKKGGD